MEMRWDLTDEMVQRIFAPIMQHYGLRYVPIDRDEFLLVKDHDYALLFGLPNTPMDEADMDYVRRGSDGELLIYEIAWYITELSPHNFIWDLEELQQEYNSVTVDLILLERILRLNWPEILRGETEWLEGFMQDTENEGGDTREPWGVEKDVLEREL